MRRPPLRRGLSAAQGHEKDPRATHEGPPSFLGLKRRAWTAEAQTVYRASTLRGMYDETPAMPAKVKTYGDLTELLAKLEGKAAMWERVARENKERSEDFERAAQAIREGATSVTVGRTTYTLYQVDETRDNPSDA